MEFVKVRLHACTHINAAYIFTLYRQMGTQAELRGRETERHPKIETSMQTTEFSLPTNSVSVFVLSVLSISIGLVFISFIFMYRSIWFRRRSINR